MGEFLRRIWSLVRPHQARLWAGTIAGFVYALGSSLLVLSVKLGLNAIYPTAGAESMVKDLSRLPAFLRGPAEGVIRSLEAGAEHVGVVWIIALVPFAMLLRGAGNYLSFYWMNWVATASVHDLRVRVFGHLQRLSMDFYGRSRTGELSARILADATAIHTVVASAFASLVKDPVTIVMLVLYLCWAEPRLTLLALCTMGLVVAPIVVFGKKVRKAYLAQLKHTAELGDQMQEAFTGSRVVRAYNLETFVTERFAATSQKISGQFMRVVRASELPGPIIEFFGALGVSIMLYYVARVANPKPNAGDFFSFIGAIFSLYQPIKSVSKVWALFEQGRAALDRMEAVLGQRPTVVEAANPEPLRAAGAEIEFDHVTFDYGDKPALRDFSLRVKPGQFVALVGRSGSGKTTAANMLLRFHDPRTGSVRIGGADLRRVSTAELRSQVALVTQETILFNDSVRANLRLGRPGATDAEIEAAARMAHAHDFIMARPGNYENVVGERGATLSGGQRQRLCIARAILRDAPVLVLDEATSALDSVSEQQVQEALDEVARGRTTICVAHRLSTIRNADQIIVLDEGRIAEKGRHEELLRADGIYADMWRRQAGGGVPAGKAENA
jgi:ATP-binding cassette, subfamily B, bacterial MsbA